MKTYKTKINKNQWQVNSWSEYYQTWVASEIMSYQKACRVVREENCKR